jgi:thymidine kinase
MSDYTKLNEFMKTLEECVSELVAMSDDIGKARTVCEFSSDRRHKALAIAQAAHLAEGVGKSETLALASPEYAASMKQLWAQHQGAEYVLAQRTALLSKIESLRTLISTEKSLAGLV